MEAAQQVRGRLPSGQDSCRERKARLGGGMVTCERPGTESNRGQAGRVEGPTPSPPHQVSDDIIALFLQPHEDAGGIQAATVGQNHGALAGHLVWRSMKECECNVASQPCNVPPGSGPTRGRPWAALIPWTIYHREAGNRMFTPPGRP